MDRKNWLLYGANGYSGELAARAAVRDGMMPVLAGRNEASIRSLAKELRLEYRLFALDDVTAIREQLWDISVVVHAAGPFSRTAQPMIEACLAAGVHYCDITGEIAVFEQAQAQQREARRQGVVLCPGVGFDVIPTDCLAAALHERMPDAVSLALGFSGDMRPSRGTARTALEGAAGGMLVRRNGELQRVTRDHALRRIDFGRGERRAAVIPWGDLSTAYWTTGIGNISVYVPERRGRLALRMFEVQRLLLNIPAVQRYLNRKIDAGRRGPDAAALDKSRMYVWGEVRDAGGRCIEGRITTANGYRLTAEGMLLAARKLRKYNGKGGYFTPSQLFGKDAVLELPGSGTMDYVEVDTETQQ